MALALAVLGIGFLWHDQHDSGDMLLQTTQHRVMGATLLLAALIKFAASLRWRARDWARTGWTLVLMVFALQLLLYAEAGAHPSTHASMRDSRNAGASSKLQRCSGGLGCAMLRAGIL